MGLCASLLRSPLYSRIGLPHNSLPLAVPRRLGFPESIGVNVFFVISGFVMWIPSGKAGNGPVCRKVFRGQYSLHSSHFTFSVRLVWLPSRLQYVSPWTGLSDSGHSAPANVGRAALHRPDPVSRTDAPVRVLFLPARRSRHRREQKGSAADGRDSCSFAAWAWFGYYYGAL